MTDNNSVKVIVRGPRWNWTTAVLFLLVLNVVSALAVVYSSHRARHLFNDTQQQYRQAIEMKEQWGRLLLEQSTWAAPQRIEQQAQQRLAMKAPEAAAIVVVTE